MNQINTTLQSKIKSWLHKDKKSQKIYERRLKIYEKSYLYLTKREWKTIYRDNLI